jgi:hypothetical protein
MVALDNGNVVLIGGHGYGYHVTMFDFEIEEWVNLANLTFYSDRYDLYIFLCCVKLFSPVIFLSCPLYTL